MYARFVAPPPDCAGLCAGCRRNLSKTYDTIKKEGLADGYTSDRQQRAKRGRKPVLEDKEPTGRTELRLSEAEDRAESLHGPSGQKLVKAALRKMKQS